jgi:AraC family transcriptional regulator
LIHDYADVRFFEPHQLEGSRLRRVLDYIGEHLEEEFTIAGLADLAHLSPFHFSRMFTRAVGMPRATSAAEGLKRRCP